MLLKLLLLLLQVLSSNCEDELGFLTPLKPIRVATAYDRILVAVTVNLEQVNGPEARMVYDGIKNLVAAFSAKDWWSQESLKEYKNSLLIAEQNAKSMAGFWLQTRDFTAITYGSNSVSNCELKINISTQTTKLQFDIIHKKWEMLSSITKEELTQPEKLNMVLDFIELVIANTAEWLQYIEKCVSELEQLKDLSLPDSYMAAFSSLKCLMPEESEFIKVISCFARPKSYNCEVDVGIPKNTKLIIKMLPVNYHGSELFLEDHHIYYKENSKNIIGQMNCTPQIIWSSNQIPLCTEMVPTTCEKTLILEDIGESIKNCDFTFKRAEPVIRVFDYGILVQSKDAVVTDGPRAMVKQVPYLLFTNYNVSILLPTGEELFIPSTNKIENPRIVTTRVTKVEQTLLHVQTWWDNFMRAFDILDYVQYLAMLVAGIFAPCAMGSLIATCKNLKKGKNVPIRQKESKQDRAAKRKENARLLERARV